MTSAASSFVGGVTGGFIGGAFRDVARIVKTVRSIPSTVRETSAAAHSTSKRCAGGSRSACGSVITTAVSVAVGLFKLTPGAGSAASSTEEGLARGQRVSANTVAAITSAVHGDWAGAGAGIGRNGWEGAKFGVLVADVAVGTHGALSIAKTTGRTVLGALDTAANLAKSSATDAVPASGIRFSQNKVNSGVPEIEASMRANGWVGEPIDVVQMGDGGLTSLDNRRVLAAKRAEIDVQANIHSFDDPIPADLAGRFKSRKGVLPATWGEAVMNRIGAQSAGYRNTWPNGSPRTGWAGD